MRRSGRPMHDLKDTTTCEDRVDRHAPYALMRVPLAGVLAWLIPGAGHLLIGERRRGLIFLIVITLTFWTGVAVGSVQGTVAPHARKLWFVAQLGTGGNALTAYGLHKMISPESATSSKLIATGNWLSAEVGVHYTGVAGLLNLLVIIDAIARADASLRTGRRRRALHVEGGT